MLEGVVVVADQEANEGELQLAEDLVRSGQDESLLHISLLPMVTIEGVRILTD